MRYAMNLTNDGRILSVTYEKYAPLKSTLVDEIPKDNITDYRFVDGEFVYDPLPKPEIDNTEPEVTTDDILNVLLGVTE